MKKLNLTGKQALTKEQMKAVVGAYSCGVNCLNEEGTLVGFVQVDQACLPPFEYYGWVYQSVCQYQGGYSNSSENSFCVC